MPTASEYLCCKELDMCAEMLKEARVADESACITNHHKYQYVVLLEAVLNRVALVAR